jgi:hypothetical protein
MLCKNEQRQAAREVRLLWLRSAAQTTTNHDYHSVRVMTMMLMDGSERYPYAWPSSARDPLFYPC